MKRSMSIHSIKKRINCTAAPKKSTQSFRTERAELSTSGEGRGQARHDASVGGKVEPEVQQAGDQVHGGAGQDAAVRQQVFGA